VPNNKVYHILGKQDLQVFLKPYSSQIEKQHLPNQWR